MKKPLTEKQLANLRAHAFKPGTSGCPGGRTPMRMLTLALRAKLASCAPGERRSVAEALADKLVDMAMGGDIDAFRLVADRCEGAVQQRVGLSGGVSLNAPYGRVLSLSSLQGLTTSELDREIDAARAVIRKNTPEGVQ